MSENQTVENVASSDLQRLLNAMKDYGEGKYDAIDTSVFDDPSIGEAFNDMLDAAVKRNNRILARINDAQSRIGDTSCLKLMFEQIDAQQDAIRRLQESRNEITPDERPLGDIDREFLSLSQQISNAVKPCIDEVNEALEEMELLGIPEKDRWSGISEDEDPMWDKLRGIKDKMSRSRDRLESIDRRVDSMSEDAEIMFGVVEKKGSLSKDFLEGVDALTSSYKNLSSECLETGRHLYRISRDIDNARNDIFRHFSRPTLHDRLRVYEVDHITLAWRLYNNIVEFESLKITQVNNTNGCKLGKWILEVEDNEVGKLQSFTALKKAHENFHARAVECFEAKQNYDIVLALDKFGEVMDALDEFQSALNQLHIELRECGDIEETDVWVFQG